ncbi:Cof-type HAD-IIB family hydrolase [Paenibacillus taiwanensis]|uniref:Cof-type HAD-IIB family hydrolase n=1 Tax=Paenibacillus taiwanensis TaxID=401638 RepID=UPI00040EBC2D|nr:Cof-type HAD-IIB family hydrolase [Paenibacillus taiwanensis]
MSYRIVFFDIDGTLLDDQKQIPASTRDAIKHLQEQGIETAIATGRTPATFAHIRETLNIHSYVSLNGGYVVRNDRVVAHTPMPIDLLDRLQAVAEPNGHALGWIGTEEMSITREHPLVDACLGVHDIEAPPVQPDLYKNCDIYQGLLFCKEAELASYVEQLPELQFIRWHDNALDVQLQGISKAIGIQHYLEDAKLEAAHSVAFGDGLNDLEMLQYVGVGVAMGNAKEEVKRVAHRVTLSASDGGIAAALQELGLYAPQGAWN